LILPGGNPAVSYVHIARCVCRRAERLVVHLSEEAVIDQIIAIYLNRLSDYLFVLARKYSQLLNAEENPWTPRI
jgi:cob(I)alamin adenosyltransferase